MDNMGGVYTAPTLLILLYLSGIERALLLSFHNNGLYQPSISSLTNPRFITSILLYIYLYNGNAHTMVTHCRLSGLSIRSSDMSPIRMNPFVDWSTPGSFLEAPALWQVPVRDFNVKTHWLCLFEGTARYHAKCNERDKNVCITIHTATNWTKDAKSVRARAR